MADKFLSEAEWKKFAKGRDLKDAPLIKALAAFEKAKKPDEQVEALADIEKQLDALRKFVKGDKDIGAYLDNVEKSMNKEEKIAKSAAKEAEATEEEEESSVLLTTKMIPLLRQIKKGEEMQAMLANGGKEVAVLLSRRSISPSKRKLLTDYLEASGTPKFALGHCIFEENAYTFVLQTQASGLAKKLKAALFKQTDLRLKVRVRGEDPSDIDDDGEPAEDELPEAEGEESTPTQQQSAIPVPPPLPVDPLKAQFETRMAALEPRVLAALKAQTGDAGKIRAVAEFVRGKGEEGNYKAAVQGLESLAKLLEASAGIPPAPPLTPQPPSTPQANTQAAQPDAEAAAFNARLAALMPEVKNAVAAPGPEAQDIKLKVSEAGVFARKKEFDRAHALLDEAEALIKAAARQQPEAEGGESPPVESQEGQDEPGDASPSAEWDRRLPQVIERFLAVLKLNPADAGKLRAVMDHANGKAEAGDHKLAVAALIKLEELMLAAEELAYAGGPDAINEDAGYKGLVAYRKSLLAFRAAIKSVDGRIAALKSAIPNQMPDEAELADELAESLSDFNAELLEAVDKAMNASENKASPVTRAVVASIDEYLLEVASNPLIKHVDANVFGVAMDIEDTLIEALTDVRDAMPALN